MYGFLADRAHILQQGGDNLKRCIIWLALFSVLLCGCETAPEPVQTRTEELRGVWISYLELDFEDKSESGFRQQIGQMFQKIADLGLNSVFVHVHSHSDAYYPSAYFPWSRYIAGEQGKDPGYDPLAIMLETARQYQLQFHAWINPFRVSTDQDLSKLSDDQPAKVFLTDADMSNDSYVVQTGQGIYLNPTAPQVQKLLIDSITELITNYAVDGVHFDDYFYPTTDAGFDRVQYESYRQAAGEDAMELADWRRANIDSFISGVYRAVKAVDDSIVFGISPQANIQTNFQTLYANVEKWGSTDGYVDYLMPQIYFGFDYPEPADAAQSFRFDNCANAWSQLIEESICRYYAGLGLYRSGEIVETESGESREWVEQTDVIQRQVEYLRGISDCQGFVLYSYGSMEANQHAKEECANLRQLLGGA